MKLIDHFDTFLEDTVNLNKTRIDTLESRVETIKNFVKTKNYQADIQRFSPQGSWAHKTIIKPPNGGEFDADLVMFVKPCDGWTAKDYVTNLYNIFNSSDRYKDKLLWGTRCITIDYAGDFHLDVVLCIVRGEYTNKFDVCNRREDEYEPTASEAYTEWLEERNTWTGNDMLRDVTKLLKYLRDIKTRFTVKSILLTTLLGDRVTFFDKYSQETNFGDLPTSLCTLMGRLDDYLQARPTMPSVENPVLSEETFTRHWDEDKYKNFRECIHRYREWIDDAYTEEDRDESVRKWRKVFGEEFAKSEVKAIACFSESAQLFQKSGFRDIVKAALFMGAGFLDRFISPSLPHVERLPWKMGSKSLPVTIVAREYATRSTVGQSYRSLTSGDIVDKNREIRFEARFSNGYPASSNDFLVQWQVVNTDREAVLVNQLRGDFYSSQEPAIRWESTKYRGAHWVEAFVISRRTNECWGRSGRFFIVIK